MSRPSGGSFTGKSIYQDCKHIVLFYSSDEERDSQIINFINEGLKMGHLCIYGTVRIGEVSYFKSIASKITNFEDNLIQGNLIVMDLAPYFTAAVRKDMTPFDEARIEFERMVEVRSDRNKKKVRFAADATGSLFKDGYIEECLAIERWWQRIHPDGITTLCQYAKSNLGESQNRERVVLSHDVILEAQ